MKLVDLNPEFLNTGNDRKGQSFSCDCPCGCGERLWIPFANPIDGGPRDAWTDKGWQRTGDTFEVMTLTPSIQRLGPCRWHGYLTNGEFRAC